ncbi:hypothetical protein ZIOFF_040715 [Zingiber officinale]|uniref:Heavy metal transport/detoxification superfamily protein n=1 Tax=Zingiber officinale TaxID=94328 RepID=A0A8J5GCW1_ZINOF|nr:hypothetical protein ZIOFF_040715 [Zingiber officinale]
MLHLRWLLDMSYTYTTLAYLPSLCLLHDLGLGSPTLSLHWLLGMPCTYATPTSLPSLCLLHDLGLGNPTLPLCWLLGLRHMPRPLVCRVFFPQDLDLDSALCIAGSLRGMYCAHARPIVSSNQSLCVWAEIPVGKVCSSLTSKDIRQNKVTVKSLADGQTLIQKLKKHGKHAELLQEVNPSVQAHEEVKEKPQKPKKIAVVESSDSSPSTAAKKIPEAEKKVEAVEKSVSEAKEAKDETPKKTEKVEMKVDEKNSETSKPPATDKSEKAPESREVEAPKKVDDNKAKSAVEFRGDHIPQPAYIMSYNMAQPSMSQSHFVTPVAAASSQGHIYDDQYRYYSRYYDGMVEAHPDPTAYMHQPAADPYNIMFSDENPNASCSLM